MDLVAKIIALHESLTQANLPHAFGGALALAWCTERARGTIDIDVNILIPASEFNRALAAMPSHVKITRQDRTLFKRDTQVRLWWDKTPIDIFLNNTPFHDNIAQRVRWETFGGKKIPFLSCQDIAVFKAFFNRTKDWADLEEMKAAGTLDITRLIGIMVEYLGAEDERITKLRKL